MHLVQILLPLYDNAKQPFDAACFAEVERVLTEQFGGATAYLRAPARGSWKSESGETDFDQIVIVEVMTESLDYAWWDQFRRSLEERFRQEQIVVRTSEITLL